MGRKYLVLRAEARRDPRRKILYTAAADTEMKKQRDDEKRKAFSICIKIPLLILYKPFGRAKSADDDVPKRQYRRLLEIYYPCGCIRIDRSISKTRI